MRKLQERLDALESEVEQLREQRDEAREEARTAAEQAASQATEQALAEKDAEEKAKAARKAAEKAIDEGNKPTDQSVVDGQRLPDYADGFHFGSYGRVVAAGDGRGRPGREADIVSWGSRFDEQTYAELELRREDYWKATGAYTRAVATIAFTHPIFHYNGDFNAKLAIRNLYMEETGLGAKNLSFWAGSRMYRGDDIYVLNFWPLDNLNTVGGGMGYQFASGTFLKIHGGVQQPNDPFYRQSVQRPAPLDQPGDQTVSILDRQKIVTSYKLGHVFRFGETAGLKILGYGETHHVRAGQRELQDYQDFEDLPADHGFVAGGELSLFTGKRSTHLNAWVRHAWNLAAYGDLMAPAQLAPDNSTKGARDLILAIGGNYEIKFFGIMGGAYFRRFRNASPDLDFDDRNEAIVLVRPQFWFGNFAGAALEASYQTVRRGVITGFDPEDTPAPLAASLWRVGIMPFLTPAGRGSYARPQIRAWYMLTVRDAGAQSLYAQDDVFSLRRMDHLIGIGAEWWFGSTSYFRD